MGSSLGRVKPKTVILVIVKHAALKSKNKDWLTQNQDNVS